MTHLLVTSATEPDLVAARMQMALSLSWHIIAACFGVGMPAITLIAEWQGHRTGDPEYRLLARRWATAMGVLFAVGVVRIPQGQYRTVATAVVRRHVRVLVGRYPVLPRHRGGCHRFEAGTARNRRRRPGDQLAEPDVIDQWSARYQHRGLSRGHVPHP